MYRRMCVCVNAYNTRRMSPLRSNRPNTGSSVVILFLVLFLCVFGLGCTNAVPEAPAPAEEGYPTVETCKRLDCPWYKVVESKPDFEIRSYRSAKWITGDTIVTAKTYNDGVREGFIPLFNYIRGGNEGKVVLNMTAPVLTDINIVVSSSKSTCSFQVYFLLPKSFQQDKAVPKGDGIRSIGLPKKQYAAVRRFGGRINDANISSELTALRKSIAAAGWRAAAASTTYSAADYNPPFQVEGRVNELILWFDK